MKTVQKVHGKVGIRLWTRAINYVVNDIMRVWMELASHRGLSLDYLLARKNVIINGLYVWLTTRALKTAVLELFQEGSDQAIERWDMEFAYDTSGSESERYETYLDRILDVAKTLGSLPPEVRYRVIVTLEPDAKEVPGWEPTTLRDVSHLQRNHLGDVIDTSRIGVAMAYYG